MDLFSYTTSVLPTDLVDASSADDVTSAVVDSSDHAPRRDFQLDDPCSRFRFWLNAVVIAILCIVGLTGNTAAIFALRRDRHHHRVAAFLLQSLALADNLVLVISFVVLTVFFGWLPLADGSVTVMRALPFVIKYVNPLGYIVQSVSIWITVILAVNRYIAVCMPYSAAERLTMKSAVIQVAAVVAISILLNLPRFFQYDIIPVRRANLLTFGYNRSEFGNNVHFELIYFNVFYTSIVLVLPLVILVVLNSSLVRQLRASKRRMQRNSLGYSGQSEGDITVIMVVIVLALVVCHTPDRIVEVVRLAAYRDTKSSECPSAMFYVSQMANILIIVSSATDFIVYYVCRRRFRLVLRDWLHRNVVRFMPCIARRWRLQREHSANSELLSESAELATTKASSRPVFDPRGSDRRNDEKGVEMVNTIGAVKPQETVDGGAEQVNGGMKTHRTN